MQDTSRSESFRRMSARGAAALAAVGLACGAFAQPPTQGEPPPVPAEQPKPPAPEPAGQGPAGEELLDSKLFDISAFVFRYAVEHPDLPSIDELGPLTVTLGVRDGVYVSARP